MTAPHPFVALRRRLEGAGVEVSPPATAADLAAFEADVVFALPTEVRAYFATVGGTEMEPDHGFDFLSFRSPAGDPGFSPEPSALTRRPGRPAVAVADYLISSFDYLACWEPGDDTAEVWAWGGAGCESLVAGTLTEFVAAVLHDAEAVNLAAMDGWGPPD